MLRPVSDSNATQQSTGQQSTGQPSSAQPSPPRRTFASDNYAGVHPEVLEAIVAANAGHAAPYGADPHTAQLAALSRHLFGDASEIVPVFGGTGANIVALRAVTPVWGAVVCAATAHINVDEGGGPERVAGLKLLQLDTPDGKLTPELVDPLTRDLGNMHRAQPLTISISQVTELGTCYTPAEVRALADFAHAHGMRLHMDGSRIANAACHLDVSLAALTSEAGVDVLSLGGTKNGLMGAEAVVALQPEAAAGLPYLRKSHGQLASKMRYVSAQLVALYDGDLWCRLASHANAMASRLSAGLVGLAKAGAAAGAGGGAGSPSISPIEGIEIAYPTQSNAVFARLPVAAKERALARFHFYEWPTDPGLVRLMCSFDTTPSDVDELLAAIAG